MTYLGTFKMPLTVFLYLLDDAEVDEREGFNADEWVNGLAGVSHQFVRVAGRSERVDNAFTERAADCVDVEVYCQPTNIDIIKGRYVDFDTTHELMCRLVAGIKDVPEDDFALTMIDGRMWKWVAASYPTKATEAETIIDWANCHHPMCQIFLRTMLDTHTK